MPSYPFIEKELSWLSFNHRVLQEAMDKSNPPIERARFLGIYSSNLDEYYRVRVADVRRRILLHQEVGGDPQARALLTAIQRRTLELNAEFELAHLEVVRTLARHNIFLENDEQLSIGHREWLRKYFHSRIRKFICPIVVSPQVDMGDVLADDATYLVAELRWGDAYTYALIEVPTDHHPRFIELPAETSRRKKPLVLLDNAIRIGLPEIFEGYFEFDQVQAWSMKMTRDAEYDLSDEIDESLMDRLSSGLKQRLTAEPTRLVHDRDMPDRVLEMLKRELGITRMDAIIAGGRYHNMKDFLGFPSIGRASLQNPDLEPIASKALDNQRNYFDVIRAKDVLLHYPYHDFYHFTEWLRQAAHDPAVESIRISLYRVASSSLVIKALLDAAANGKEVSVIVELQARFDEENNIRWSKLLTDSGVHVSFGIANLKVHSKLCLITRKEGDQRVRYAHIGTGNFNEKTARIYTDFSLLTARPEITDEVREVFAFVQAPYRRVKFKHLWVSPTTQRHEIYRRIDREIELAETGRRGRILIKVNNLADTDLVTKLYEANRAGVQIDACVRGMCTLIPGIPGLSDRIRVISIVDRFLEHPRVAVFYNDGDPEVFISSADWMTRNLDNRVEVATPIYDTDHKKTIIDLMELQFKDTTKARWIDEDQTNPYVNRGNRRKVRTQMTTYHYIKQLESD
ncbi:MAG: polyphosphate kinase 1 [Litorivicinaceae bacterium]|nr:MAG: polyphosphate kinase 1 [Litorivicinaceae bacterium]